MSSIESRSGRRRVVVITGRRVAAAAAMAAVAAATTTTRAVAHTPRERFFVARFECNVFGGASTHLASCWSLHRRLRFALTAAAPQNDARQRPSRRLSVRGDGTRRHARMLVWRAHAWSRVAFLNVECASDASGDGARARASFRSTARFDES